VVRLAVVVKVVLCLWFHKPLGRPFIPEPRGKPFVPDLAERHLFQTPWEAIQLSGGNDTQSAHPSQEVLGSLAIVILLFQGMLRAMYETLSRVQCRVSALLPFCFRYASTVDSWQALQIVPRAGLREAPYQCYFHPMLYSISIYREVRKTPHCPSKSDVVNTSRIAGAPTR